MIHRKRGQGNKRAELIKLKTIFTLTLGLIALLCADIGMEGSLDAETRELTNSKGQSDEVAVEGEDVGSGREDIVEASHMRSGLRSEDKHDTVFNGLYATAAMKMHAEGKEEIVSDDVLAKVPEEVKEEMGAGLGVKRNLVFMTTHYSPTHIAFLNECWLKIIPRLKFFREADFLLYSATQPDQSLMESVFAGVNVMVKLYNNTAGKQLGAIQAYEDAVENGWFEGYEWIMRVNPDVVVLEDEYIRSKLTDDVDGLFTDCKDGCVVTSIRRPMKCPPCTRHCHNARPHTDFTVFRPGPIIESVRRYEHPRINAEDHTKSVIQDIVKAGRDAWMNGDHPGVGLMAGFCRIRGPSSPVVHDHNFFRKCGDLNISYT